MTAKPDTSEVCAEISYATVVAPVDLDQIYATAYHAAYTPADGTAAGFYAQVHAFGAVEHAIWGLQDALALALTFC